MIGKCFEPYRKLRQTPNFKYDRMHTCCSMSLLIVDTSLSVPFATGKRMGSTLFRSKEPPFVTPNGGSLVLGEGWGCKSVLVQGFGNIEYHDKHTPFSFTAHLMRASTPCFRHAWWTSTLCGCIHPLVCRSIPSDPLGAILPRFEPRTRLIRRTVVRPRDDSTCYRPTVSFQSMLCPNGCSCFPIGKGACSGLSFQELPIEPGRCRVRNDTNPSPSTSTSRPNRSDASRNRMGDTIILCESGPLMPHLVHTRHDMHWNSRPT